MKGRQEYGQEALQSGTDNRDVAGGGSGVVLADAGYGNDSEFRRGVRSLNLRLLKNSFLKNP